MQSNNNTTNGGLKIKAINLNQSLYDRKNVYYMVNMAGLLDWIALCQFFQLYFPPVLALTS